MKIIKLLLLSFFLISKCISQISVDSSLSKFPVYRFCTYCYGNRDVIYFNQNKFLDVTKLIGEVEFRHIDDTSRIFHFQKVFEYMDAKGYDLISNTSEIDIFHNTTNVMYFFFKKRK